MFRVSVEVADQFSFRFKRREVHLRPFFLPFYLLAVNLDMSPPQLRFEVFLTVFFCRFGGVFVFQPLLFPFFVFLCLAPTVLYLTTERKVREFPLF